jgi:hypothetical protein
MGPEMTQLSFATLEHRNKKKQTKRERFLSEMDAVVPWAANAHLGSNLTVCRMKHSTGWPPEADGVDRPGGPDHARSGNVRFWDVATVHETDAKQRKPSSVRLQVHLYGGHDGTTAVPSEAESRRS